MNNAKKDNKGMMLFGAIATLAVVGFFVTGTYRNLLEIKKLKNESNGSKNG